MRRRHLAVAILQNIAVCAVQHAGRSAGEARRVLAEAVAAASGFNADQPHVVLFQERVKHPDGVRSAAHAGKDRIGQAAFALQNFLARLLADDAMKIAHHHRIRMCAQGGAEQIMGGLAFVNPSPLPPPIPAFRVRLPFTTLTTLAPSIRMRNTFSRCRRISSSPIYTVQSKPNSAQTVAVATPCWPAPVSAMMRRLPIRRASSAWPRQLLILWAPVCSRSSRLR